MSDWQPIETAPKDGTILRLWNKTWPGEMRGQWDRRAKEWQASPMVVRLGPEQHVEDPTHWMPLPEPPK